MNRPIFDSHAHYMSHAFDADRKAVLESLPAKGVVGICEQATGWDDAKACLDLAKQYPFMVAAIGIHPQSLMPAEECDGYAPSATISRYGGDWQKELDDLAVLMSDPKVVAIGECGLDHYWPIPKDAQLEMFEAHLQLAHELQKPIIVHDREAHADTYELLKKYKPKGILHCYSGSAEDAIWLAKQGMLLGFGGTCTFKNARKTREAIEVLPLESIVLETDCPYLTPEPFRGKRNDSSLISYIGDKIAEVKNIAPETVFETTAQTAKAVFAL